MRGRGTDIEGEGGLLLKWRGFMFRERRIYVQGEGLILKGKDL